MNSFRTPWDEFEAPKSGQQLTFKPLSDCEGLQWVRGESSEVGIAVDFPSGSSYNAGQPYQSLEFSLIELSPSLKVFCVMCHDSNLIELFADLCFSLIKVLKTIQEPIARAQSTILRANAWCDLLKRGKKDLSREQIMGLVCELKFLQDKWLNSNRTIHTWFGPERKTQDFLDDQSTIAVEVKHISTENIFRISSIYQLEYQGALYLYGYKLKSSDNGESLNELTELLKSKLSPTDASDFESKLVSMGYISSTAYDEKFEIIETTCFEVSATFPKIIKGSLPGIVQASYSIQISEEFKQFEITEKELEARLER